MIALGERFYDFYIMFTLFTQRYCHLRKIKVFVDDIHFHFLYLEFARNGEGLLMPMNTLTKLARSQILPPKTPKFSVASGQRDQGSSNFENHT